MDLDNPRMPQLRVKMKTPAPRLRIATWPEIDALTQAADTMYLTSISMAVLLSLFQGQRETDIPISRADQFRQQSFIDPVSRKQVTDWTWRLNRSKRGTLGVMRLHPVLSERMPTMLSGLSPEDYLLRDERTGTPFGADAPAFKLFRLRRREVFRANGKDCPSIVAQNGTKTRASETDALGCSGVMRFSKNKT